MSRIVSNVQQVLGISNQKGLIPTGVVLFTKIKVVYQRAFTQDVVGMSIVSYVSDCKIPTSCLSFPVGSG